MKQPKKALPHKHCVCGEIETKEHPSMYCRRHHARACGVGAYADGRGGIWGHPVSILVVCAQCLSQIVEEALHNVGSSKPGS